MAEQMEFHCVFEVSLLEPSIGAVCILKRVLYNSMTHCDLPILLIHEGSRPGLRLGPHTSDFQVNSNLVMGITLKR